MSGRDCKGVATAPRLHTQAPHPRGRRAAPLSPPGHAHGGGAATPAPHPTDARQDVEPADGGGGGVHTQCAEARGLRPCHRGPRSRCRLRTAGRPVRQGRQLPHQYVPGLGRPPPGATPRAPTGEAGGGKDARARGSAQHGRRLWRSVSEGGGSVGVGVGVIDPPLRCRRTHPHEPRPHDGRLRRLPPPAAAAGDAAEGGRGEEGEER